MSAFNRNIITNEDIRKFAAAQVPEDVPKTLDTNPPGGLAAPVLAAVAAPAAGGAPAVGGAPAAGGAPAVGGAAAGGGGAAPGGVPVPSEDDYLTKLLKYVPLEVLGAYLFLAGVIDSNVTKPHDRALWFGGLLIGILVISIPYDIRVLGVVRPAQIFLGLVGLAVYVFSVGGWFATTSWYEAWYAAIALPVFGLLVAIIKLKPLPTAGA